MTRMTPEKIGWDKIARKHYRHESGVEVRYNCNAWAWEIIGGSEDGYKYGTLSIAQYSALRGTR